MKKSTYLAYGLVLLTAGGGTALLASRDHLWGTDQPSGLFRAEDAGIVKHGSDLYVANCASCHGSKLEGQPNWRTPGEDGLLPAPPHDETGHTWHHTDQVLFGITKHGVAEFSGLEGYKSAMPIYVDILNDEEIIAVLSFIKSRWPEEIRTRHDEMNRQSINN